MTDDREKLERLVAGLAAVQPVRRAPASLQTRVLAQIAAQQSTGLGSAQLPWWRRGFVHWPLAAQAFFLLASIGLVRLVVAGFVSVAGFVQDVAYFAVHTVPTVWLYGAAGFAFVLYAMLFGLGTFAYRALYVQR